MVLQNIHVRHPCPEESQEQAKELAFVKEFNRAEEEQRMGGFDLEEAFSNVLTMLGDDCDFNHDQLQDFNLNMEQVIRDQKVERGQNNITASGQGQMNVQPKMGMGM